MQGRVTPLPPSLMGILPQWMARQRWYTGKGRAPALTRIGGLRLEDPAREVGIDVHLIRDESGQAPTTYQVPLTSRTAPLTGFEHALVATLKPRGQGGGNEGDHGDDRDDRYDRYDRYDEGDDGDDGDDGTRYIYDAPHDPAFVSALLRLMMQEQTAAFDETAAEVGAEPLADHGALYGADGHRLAAADPGEPLASHVLTGEQSNTSIIIDLVDTLGNPSKPLICKLFRVLHHGQNPDVVVQSALSAAGSTLVPGSVGYVAGRWPASAASGGSDGVAAGHLAFAQEFLPGVQDAWRVACGAVATGADFSEQARSLGHATAQVHASLAQAMGTREATQNDVAALTRSMRARHASALSEVPAMAVYDQMVHASIEAVSLARWPALQRIHGDYHLGQVLDAPGRGWVLVDFEGEPLRPLAERNQPDLGLRDVAGMLRSFDYVAGSWEQEHPGHSAAPWAAAARTAFLEGYTVGAGRDPREDAVLLNALELDKALYEVVYEARHRPTWLGIPTTAIARIARLSDARRSDLRS